MHIMAAAMPRKLTSSSCLRPARSTSCPATRVPNTLMAPTPALARAPDLTPAYAMPPHSVSTQIVPCTSCRPAVSANNHYSPGHNALAWAANFSLPLVQPIRKNTDGPGNRKIFPQNSTHLREDRGGEVDDGVNARELLKSKNEAADDD